MRLIGPISPIGPSRSRSSGSWSARLDVLRLPVSADDIVILLIEVLAEEELN
jgi:hypothetical protein